MLIGLAVALVVALIAGLAVALAGGGKKPAAGGVSSGPSPSPSVAPPGSVVVADDEAFRVTLTWTPASTGTPVETYDVFRNGSVVGAVAAPTATFTDTKVSPGKTYTYEVAARGGGATSSRVSVTVTTPVPPVGEGRVEGDFNVVLKVVSKSGFSSYPSPITLGWHFSPKCPAGPCNVVWKDVNEKTLKATLTFKKGTYSGSDEGHFGGRCGSAKTTSEITIVFHVAKARGKSGEWMATKIVGTVTEVDAAQLGCVSARAALSLTGTPAG